MKMFPTTLSGFADYVGYAAGLIIGYGILSPLFMQVEDSLRKGE